MTKKSQPVYQFSVSEALGLLRATATAAVCMRGAVQTVLGAAKKCETDQQKLAIWDVLVEHLELAEADFLKINNPGPPQDPRYSPGYRVANPN